MNSLFSSLHNGGAIGEIFSERGFVERCLRFERELAAVQAELGVIPREAADEIGRVAQVENIDFAALKQSIQAVGLPLVGLVDQVVRLCDGDLGQYVHYGATTQDVMDSAVALQMQEAFALIDDSLAGIARALDQLAHAHQGTIQAGRTNQQHALPLTFGFKAAVWGAAVRRHLERLPEIARRAATGQLGGAVGTLASFAEVGHETRGRLMRRLKLGEPQIAWHSMRDIPAEAVLFLAQIAGTLGKVGRDVLVMSSTEVAEISFSADRGASSTMPQKSNPVAASSVVALSRLLFHTAPMLLDAALVEHERSLDAWYVEIHALPLCFGIAGSLLGQARTMLAELTVHAERMADNAALSRGAIVSETVQMELAKHIGLNRAHALVARACRQARQDGNSLEQTLQGYPADSLGAAVADLPFGVAGHARFGIREVKAATPAPEE